MDRHRAIPSQATTAGDERSSTNPDELQFSVVITTCRRPHQLVEAVDSVLGQQHPASEILVVSDGPDPTTGQALQRFEGSAVRYIETDGGGLSVSRNTGARAAFHEWIAFLDDDDLWHPRHLANAADLFTADPSARAAYSSPWRFSTHKWRTSVDMIAADLDECIRTSATLTEAGRSPRWASPRITGASYQRLLEAPWCPTSMIVHRDLFEASGGFPENVSLGEDWMFSVEVAQLDEWHHLPEATLFYRIQPGSLSSNRAPDSSLRQVEVIETFWRRPPRPGVHRPPLARYSRWYRGWVSSAIWRPLLRRPSHRRDPLLAWRGLRTGWPLVRRWRDRLYLLIPLPVLYRIRERRPTHES